MLEDIIKRKEDCERLRGFITMIRKRQVDTYVVSRVSF